jgi:hypothetical protein
MNMAFSRLHRAQGRVRLGVLMAASLLINSACKEDDKDPTVQPAPPSYTTQEYLATLAPPRQTFTIDTQQPFRAIGRRGTIVEIAANALVNVDPPHAPIARTVEIELLEAATRKDMILHGLSLNSSYMDIGDGMLRFTQAFALTCPAENTLSGPSGYYWPITVKVPVTDPALAQANRVRLVDGMYVGDTTVVHVSRNWADTGLRNIFGRYEPPVTTDPQTGQQYHVLEEHYPRFMNWMGCVDAASLAIPPPGSIHFYPESRWTSPSSVLPVIYLLPEATLTGVRLKVTGPRAYHDKVTFANGTRMKQIGIQYDHGNVYFGKRTIVFDNSILSTPPLLELRQVTEAELVAELDAL